MIRCAFSNLIVRLCYKDTKSLNARAKVSRMCIQIIQVHNFCTPYLIIVKLHVLEEVVHVVAAHCVALVGIKRTVIRSIQVSWVYCNLVKPYMQYMFYTNFSGFLKSYK